MAIVAVRFLDGGYQWDESQELASAESCEDESSAHEPQPLVQTHRHSSDLAANIKSLSVNPSILCVQIVIRTFPQAR